jgi:blue copper oxidase
VWSPELTIRQPAATARIHPHPHGSTARQVYSGLAGLMIVSDGADGDRGLPVTYGVDDLPIVLQDKRFGRGGMLAYDSDMMDLMHGFQGDTLVVNGAIGPVARVSAGYVRLRLLNAANARIFDLRFWRPFFVIAGDGGFLVEPVEVRSLVIAPGERYEVLVDFADGRAADLVTAPDAGHGTGMMMPMMAPRRQVAGTAEPFMRFEPDLGLKAAVTRLPRQPGTLTPPDVKTAVAWRTFELNPMMGMGGMMGMGMMHGPGQGEGLRLVVRDGPAGSFSPGIRKPVTTSSSALCLSTPGGPQLGAMADDGPAAAPCSRQHPAGTKAGSPRPSMQRMLRGRWHDRPLARFRIITRNP